MKGGIALVRKIGILKQLRVRLENTFHQWRIILEDCFAQTRRDVGPVIGQLPPSLHAMHTDKVILLYVHGVSLYYQLEITACITAESLAGIIRARDEVKPGLTLLRMRPWRQWQRSLLFVPDQLPGSRQTLECL